MKKCLRHKLLWDFLKQNGGVQKTGILLITFRELIFKKMFQVKVVGYKILHIFFHSDRIKID